MDEQLEQNVETQENETQKYLDAINDIKKNTVDKTEYDKLKEENRTLLNSIVNGQKYSAEETESEPKYTKEELVKTMLTPGIDSAKYVDAACKFRDMILEETGKDVFVAQGHFVSPTPESQAAGERAYEVYKQCLDSSNGKSKEFSRNLSDRTNDIRVPGMKY